jgi:hypothetical protein
MLVKLTPRLNFINILPAVFVPVVLRQSYWRTLNSTGERRRMTTSAFALCAIRLVKLTHELKPIFSYPERSSFEVDSATSSPEVLRSDLNRSSCNFFFEWKAKERNIIIAIRRTIDTFKNTVKNNSKLTIHQLTCKKVVNFSL